MATSEEGNKAGDIIGATSPRPISVNASNGAASPYHVHAVQTPPIVVHLPATNKNNNEILESYEPAEAIVARPLSIIALFAGFQLWFALPAIFLAFRRNGTILSYKISIGLSVVCISIAMLFHYNFFFIWLARYLRHDYFDDD